MNEDRFIELLNLYVDQQLSPAEAKELEAEIQGSSSRRRTYHQYCRMQKACTQLFESERSSAPDSLLLARALAAADHKIARMDSRRRLVWSTGFSLAAIAAAACVAIMFVGHTGSPVVPTSQKGFVAAQEVKPVAETARVMPVAAVERAPVASARTSLAIVEFKPAFTVQQVSVSEDQPSLFTATNQNVAAIDWAQQIQLTPIRKTPLSGLNTGTTVSEKAMPVAFQNNGTAEQPVAEMSAFEFQR